EDDERRPLIAALDTDRVLDPLQSTHPWALNGRLDVVAREHRPGRRRTVEIEATALQRSLNRRALLAGDDLSLTRARRHDPDHGAERQACRGLSHVSPPPRLQSPSPVARGNVVRRRQIASGTADVLPFHAIVTRRGRSPPAPR